MIRAEVDGACNGSTCFRCAASCVSSAVVVSMGWDCGCVVRSDMTATRAQPHPARLAPTISALQAGMPLGECLLFACVSSAAAAAETHVVRRQESRLRQLRADLAPTAPIGNQIDRDDLVTTTARSNSIRSRRHDGHVVFALQPP